MMEADVICEACLSRDRVMLATTPDVQVEYCSIIHKRLNVPTPLLLCWECISKLKNHIYFKRQCELAYETLMKFRHKPDSIKSLSNLSIARNIVDINIYNTNIQKDGVYNIHQHNNEKVKIHNQTQSEINILNQGDDIKTNKKDITFIKVEGHETMDDDFYDGDEYNHHTDDTTVKVDCGEEIGVVSKRSNKKLTEDGFDESDEEPLYNKKKENTVKRNKKKKNNAEESKRPVRRREKPPGVVNNPRVNRKLQQLNVADGQLEMVVLSWDEVEEERMKLLSSHVFTRHEYRCSECIVGFNHKFKLINHMKKHDPSSGDLMCNVCKVRCKDAHALGAHRRRHRVRWRCCSCGETSSRAAVAADHVARQHGAPPPTHTCTVCGHSETTLGRLRNHIKNHAERQKCELCGKSFRDRTSLRTHLFIHKGEKEYSCPRCDKQFLFKKAMEVHLITHDAPAHLYCHQCDLTFKNSMSYTQHMKYSLKHIDPAKLKYACQLCDKKFVKATRLEEHNLAVHLKATPVSCNVPECNFVCSSRPVLRTHIRMVHRNARALRNHVCDICGKTYTTKKALEGHMRSHTGERPFKCLLCPSTFGYEAALYNHNKLVHLKGKMCRRPQQLLQVPGPNTDLS